MKRQAYDYSGFSLKKITDPRFSHALLLIGWPVYFAMYFLTEKLIPYENCHPIHSFMDDLIPFNEYFLIFYVAWYALVIGSLAYTFFYDVPRFKKLQTYIMLTQALAMLCYIFYPSIQHLRPAAFERDNIFTRILGFIYAFDTPTGVFPSLHVGYSIAILSVGLKDEHLKKWQKVMLYIFVFLICISICFVKQHSFADIYAAIIMCMIPEVILFGKDYWLPTFSKLRKANHGTGQRMGKHYTHGS